MEARFGLHVVTGRREDRLLFDHQIKLAQTFGYEDASYTLAVEQFMQRYYRTVMDVSLLYELLLQLFREAILNESEPPRPLNPRFQMRSGSLEAINDDIFVRTPSTLLELFVLLQQNPDIKGLRASTMRAVGRSLWLIDEEFRQNPRHHRLFLEILRSPVGVTHELRRMNTYGVLGRYIPAFGRIWRPDRDRIGSAVPRHRLNPSSGTTLGCSAAVPRCASTPANRDLRIRSRSAPARPRDRPRGRAEDTHLPCLSLKQAENVLDERRLARSIRRPPVRRQCRAAV